MEACILQRPNGKLHELILLKAKDAFEHDTETAKVIQIISSLVNIFLGLLPWKF